jgi:soluble lytic murein transglycosylase-like protein
MNLNLHIPMTNMAFYENADLPILQKTLKSIASQYFTEISLAEKLTNVPAAIILSVIQAESKGNAIVVSRSGAVGLMQLKPQSAHDAIFLENKNKRLTEAEKTELRKYLGTRLDAIFKQKYLSHKIAENNFTGNVITAKDLKNTRFNVLVGSIYLGMLIDQHIENGMLRMDKVIVRYNQGYFYKPKGANIQETLATEKKRSAESYAYILKVVGKNGLLDAHAKLVNS